MAEKIDAKYLEGLLVTGSKPKEQKLEGGGKKTVYVAFEQAATPDDVLTFSDKGNVMVIVLKDGKKYNVQKKAEKKAAPPPPAKLSTEFNADEAVNMLAKMNTIAEIKTFVKGDERVTVTKAAESALSTLK